MTVAMQDSELRAPARRAVIDSDTAIPNTPVRDSSYLLLPSTAVLALLTGLVVYVVLGDAAADVVWAFLLVITGAPVVWGTIRALQRGHFATDVVASLSIVGAFLLGHPFAGLVIVLMQTGGEALERLAEGRASSAVHALEAAAPRIAHRVLPDGVVDVPVSDVRIGDVLLIRPGDLVPCDGLVVDGRSDLDMSRLTGEPAPVEAAPGAQLLSGCINGTGVLRLEATALAADSQYARIVALVRSAAASKAPLQRLADRYAVWFTPLTILACIITFAITHEWIRVLAVLVVATPCPLILATPVAIVGGFNRAARGQIIIRSGTALERLSAVTVAVFDKTGTITVGQPRVDRVIALGGFDEPSLLRYAGAAEHGSSHILGRVLTSAARERLGDLPEASDYLELPGQGIAADVCGHRVVVGARGWVLSSCDGANEPPPTPDEQSPGLRAYVAVDGRLAGMITYADEVRPDAATMLERLKRQGIRRTLMISGDSELNARDVAARVGIQEAHGQMMPEDKLAILRRVADEGNVVMMVGDGINDAPALKAADVGVAIAQHGGGGITTEAADVILLTESLDRVNEARRISRRTMRIARQSIVVGLGLSAAAMVVGAWGFLSPTGGAVLQEGIDIAVIVNALRASRA